MGPINIKISIYHHLLSHMNLLDFELVQGLVFVPFPVFGFVHYQTALGFHFHNSYYLLFLLVGFRLLFLVVYKVLDTCEVEAQRETHRLVERVRCCQTDTVCYIEAND